MGGGEAKRRKKLNTRGGKRYRSQQGGEFSLDIIFSRKKWHVAACERGKGSVGDKGLQWKESVSRTRFWEKGPRSKSQGEFRGVK